MLTRIQAALRAPDAGRRLSDFVLAGALFALPERLRRALFAGERHTCPVCEARLSRFVVLHRPFFLWCPVCRSLQRQRLLWLLFTRRQFLSPARPQRWLHFAPEPCLTRRLAAQPSIDYVSADLYDPAAMIRMDITQIQFPDQSFDVILCSHVLEHVPDDRAALRELRRVLKPDGQAVILVPITAAVTVEDPSITDPVQRELLFGQHDHVRRYGPDFELRLQQAGFATQRLVTEDLASSTEINRLGLTEREVVYLAHLI